jgi:hypothetical protein
MWEPQHLTTLWAFTAWYRDIFTLLYFTLLLLYYYYGTTALYWALADFSIPWSQPQSVGLLGRGMSPSQGLYLHTEQHKHRINAHRHPCSEWDWNPGPQCSNEGVRFMPRGHCDRLHSPLLLHNVEFKQRQAHLYFVCIWMCALWFFKTHACCYSIQGSLKEFPRMVGMWPLLLYTVIFGIYPHRWVPQGLLLGQISTWLSLPIFVGTE